MSNKTKKDNNKNFNQLYTQIGVLLMSAATIFSGLDMTHQKTIVLPSKPVLAFQGQNNDVNAIRRERDETVPHYISYSETQRTPSRSSRH